MSFLPHRSPSPAVKLRWRLAFAAAGAAGAAIWALQQPLDKKLLRHGYDDVELLGRAVRPDGAWQAPGWAMHVANGAMFGLAYSELRRRTPHVPAHVTAMSAVMAENVGLFPLSIVSDRFHPARDQLATTWHPRAFAQATWRHAILGIVIGEVGRRLPSTPGGHR